MFFRLVREAEGVEVLFNSDHITKLEVLYVVPRKGQLALKVPLAVGIKGLEQAIRVYKVHVAGEVLHIPSDPNSPVSQLLEKIYHSAVKDPDKHDIGDPTS